MKLDEGVDSDISENEEQYIKLASAVSELDNKKRVRPPSRKELSSVVSEFYLPKGTKQSRDLVNVKELTEVLGHKTNHAQIGKKLQAVVKNVKTLPKPLEKPVAERIKRAVGYKNVVGQLKKWDAIVETNRVSDDLKFPLQQGKVSLQSSHQFLSKFKPQTPLEIEMSKILNEEQKSEIREMEKELNEKLEFPLTLEELLEKRKELAQLRAKLSYKEAKACRQSKIKSKKYHRIMKREKIRQQLKEFEQLQKTNPKAALKKLEELDKSRAQERASLRHKNTGKWARNLAVRSKYDTESRKVLAEQLKLSRDLTAKVNDLGDDDDESDDGGAVEATTEVDAFMSKDNPWALNVSSEVSNFYVSGKKYWEEKNKEKGNSASTVSVVHSKKMSESESTSAGEKGTTNGLLGNDGVIGLNRDSSTAQNGNSSSSVSGNSENLQTGSAECDRIVSTKAVKSGNEGLKSNGLKRTSVAIFNETPQKSQKVENKGSGKNVDILKERKSQVGNSTKKVKGKKSTDSGSSKTVTKKVKSSSGTWTVASTNERDKKVAKKRNNAVDLDDLFDELDEKLEEKRKKKLVRLKKATTKRKGKEEMRAEKEEDESEPDEDLDLSLKRNAVRPDLDVELGETTGHQPGVDDEGTVMNLDTTTITVDSESTSAEEPPTDIDPNKFIEVKTQKLKTKLPDNLVADENYVDDEEETQRMNIVEAFDDDDIVEEFKEMKKEEEESTKLELPGELPGWGSWGGTDIKPSPRKTKRNMINVKLPKRKDHQKKYLIISEKTDSKAVEHMVKEIPHPFKSVGAFEANIRNPVGREWVPESAHQKFIKPPVETKLGSIIEPMDDSALLELKKQKSLFKGKTRAKGTKK